MSDSRKHTIASGPELIRAAAAQAVDLLSGRLLRQANDQGGGLTVPAIRDIVEEFQARPTSALSAVFEEAWKTCLAKAEATHWRTARKFHFERVMVKCFSALLPRSDEVVESGRHLSRRIIPGFTHALQQMMGPETYAQYAERTTALVDALRAVHGEGFTWNEVYADPSCQEVVETVLVDIAYHFSDMAKRRNWMIDVVDAHMPATSNEAEKAWAFDDGAFHVLMNMLYGDLREQVQDTEGRRALEARHGAGKIADLEILLAGLRDDHADLMQAGRL